MKNGMKFKKGYWVVLGESGYGWDPSVVGEICKIKIVFDTPTIFDYDIILDDMSNHKLIGLQCSEESKRLRGCSSKFMRLATYSEVKNHCEKNNIRFDFIEDYETQNYEEWIYE